MRYRVSVQITTTKMSHVTRATTRSHQGQDLADLFTEVIARLPVWLSEDVLHQSEALDQIIIHLTLNSVMSKTEVGKAIQDGNNALCEILKIVPDGHSHLEA